MQEVEGGGGRMEEDGGGWRMVDKARVTEGAAGFDNYQCGFRGLSI